MLSYRNGLLQMEGEALEPLARRLRTPFFLISERQLVRNFRSLSSGLASEGVTPLLRYCAKANHELGVLRVFAAMGSQVLVSHSAEADLALRAGYPAQAIAYQRPVLPPEDLRAVLEMGVRLVHAYRSSDIWILREEAERAERRLQLSLRLRDDSFPRRLSPLRFLSGRFGFSLAEIPSALDLLKASPWLELRGLNFYIGTQQTSATGYAPLLRQAMRVARLLESAGENGLREVNVGGGVPSPTMDRIGVSWVAGRVKGQKRSLEEPGGGRSRLEGFASDLSRQFAREARRAGLRETPILAVEPGRSLVGNTAVLVTSVRAVQGSWLFLDGSRNHLGESPLLFRRDVLPAQIRSGARARRYHLSGSTLNTRDLLDLWRRLPEPRPGDVLILADAGAYSLSRSTRYAGLNPPVYMLGMDGAIRLIRRAEGAGDLAAQMLAGEGS